MEMKCSRSMYSVARTDRGRNKEKLQIMCAIKNVKKA